MAVAASRGAAASATEAFSFGTEVGRQIFVYQKIDTKQIVYSLTRSMRNKEAMRQLTFVGKKSVPAALRKDLWTPLCVLSFPNTLQGLSAYKALIEFKHLHEVSYPLEIVQDPEQRAGIRLPKAKQTKVLQDQKANSIADMAHVLTMQRRPPTEQELRQARYNVHAEGVKKRPPPGAPISKHRPGHKHTAEVLEFRGKLDGVSVWWADPMDAEYAQTWPAEVLHGSLAVNRSTAIWPPPEEILLGRRATPAEIPHNEGSSGQPPVEQPSRWSRLLGRRTEKPVVAVKTEPSVD